jgi:outer membrane receptor protein involved in Fe transport
LDRVEDQSGALANADEFISAYDLVDLTFAFEADERLTLTLGVNNLFDTLPGTPIVDPATGDVINDPNNLLLGGNASGGESNTYPNTYDVLGRSFFASVFLEF